MQRMRPDIPPVSIQSDLARGRPGARYFENTARDPECRIGSHNFDARNPLGHLSPLCCGHVPLLAVVLVDVGDFGPGEVSEGFGRAEVREEGAVAGQDVGFGRGGGGGGGSVGPGAGVLGCVG